MQSLLVTRLYLSAAILVTSLAAVAQSGRDSLVKNSFFTVRPEKYGISSLLRTGDLYPTNYVRRSRVFGEVIVRYVSAGKLDSAKASLNCKTTILHDGKIVNTWPSEAGNSQVLQLSQSFSLYNDALTWSITVENTSTSQVRIEDLSIPLFYNSGGGENPKEIFEERVVKHHFISGNNSYIFWQRPTGLGPYLVMVPVAGAKLEYFSTTADATTERGAFQAFIHSSLTGNKELRGKWRQPHTSASLGGKESKTYTFKFRWAKNYRDIRSILFEEGLIDVQVMPGMTIPDDLDVTIALRTKQKINALQAEFAPATDIQYLGEKGKGTHLYRIRFSRLGENMLTIDYGENYKTYLEFFVTEPLETLYRKRASFIVKSQQHRDHSKWYDGLFGVYDMKNAQLRGPDNADYFDTSRLKYVLTCDDPGLCKAPFVAAKNVYYPDQQEIEAVEYYIKNFVWGKLQRTESEAPYPYGVYGTPSWLVNRDTVTRKKNMADPNRDKMHVWRSYDYPHIMMLYYHMYQVATLYPGMTHYLDKKGYLIRAKETAKAFFTYPYDILPWYETYKWGCYNELLIPDLIADLVKEGYSDDAAFLRGEWEKKVKYFIYDDPYPFRSEYAIDATAFESSHALAKYAVLNTMRPDSNLWYDKNVKKWYSHPVIRKEDGIRFMHRQMQANLALRGVIEPAYYYLGSDFRGRSDGYTLSYMSQMGGWSVLDYALHFSDEPADYIRLGYASYLSSFALINSGTPESNYGFWFPGKETDGAAGWAFEPQKYITPWIQKPQGRGPWYYDGEIDLGFGGATRMAATVVTNDPIFGMVAYGGRLTQKNGLLETIPKDGLRRRFYYRNGNYRADLELDSDGFAKDKKIAINPSCGIIELFIENRQAGAHTAQLKIKGLSGTYRLKAGNQAERKVVLDGHASISFPVDAVGLTPVKLIKAAQ